MNVIKNSILGSLGLLAASLTPATAEDRALIIGVSDYAHEEVDDLPAAARDAIRFRDFIINELEFAPEAVVTLVDEYATADMIIGGILAHLVDGTNPGDRVVFYFAGHGGRHQDRNGDEADDFDESILAHDAGMFLSETNGVLVDDILDLLFSRLNDRRVMLVFDSCHSGTVTRTMLQDASIRNRYADLPNVATPFSLDLLPEQQRARSNGEGPMASDQGHRTVWSAAAASQSSWEDNNGGVFTNAFIAGYAEGRADRNLNGRITNAELLSYVRRETEIWCANAQPCREANLGFTPEFRGPIEAEAGLPLIPIADQIPTEDLAGTEIAPVVPEAQTELAAAENTTIAAQPPEQVLQPLPDAEDSPSFEIVAPFNPETSQIGAMAPVEPMGQVSDNDQLFTLAVLDDLFSVENVADLRLDLNTGSQMRAGDIVSFTIRSANRGHVVLLDLNPDGELYQIFPSPLSAPGVTTISAGGELVIPEGQSVNGVPLQIRVTDEHTGRGQLLAILVEADDVGALTGLLPADLAPGPIPDAETVLFNLADALNRVQANAQGNRLINWSAAYVDYNIVSR